MFRCVLFFLSCIVDVAQFEFQLFALRLIPIQERPSSSQEL